MGSRILIVEDEVISAGYIESALRKMGFLDVGRVSTGEAALKAVLEDRPALILMDINLGGPQSGIEAARDIGSTQAIPIIFITGYSDVGIFSQAEALKPVAIIQKPINMRLLERRIRECLVGAAG